MKKLLATALFIAACGDNNSSAPDAAVDSTTPTDTGSTFTPPPAKTFGLSAAGPDQVQSAVAGPEGSFYAVGFKAADTQAATADWI